MRLVGQAWFVKFKHPSYHDIAGQYNPAFTHLHCLFVCYLHIENIGWRIARNFEAHPEHIGRVVLASVDYLLMECGTSTNGQVHYSCDTAAEYKYAYLTSTPLHIWTLACHVQIVVQCTAITDVPKIDQLCRQCTAHL